MRQTDEFEDTSGGLPLIFMAIGVSFFVLFVLLLVFFLNQDKGNRNTPKEPGSVSQTTEAKKKGELGDLISGSDRVASDLDFWDMYPIGEEKKKEPEKEVEPEEEEKPDPSTDGKHVEVVFRDGSSEWVPINPYWKRNKYDFTNLVSKNNLLHYYSDGKQISYLGVDLSKYQKEVNFAALKDAGIDFCMLRVGARGYETGALQADEYFDKYLAAAEEAGLSTGVYFYSQAVTEAEAIEEAGLVLQKIQGHKITYPIAYDMEFVENDTSRIETLTRDEKSRIALAFLNTIEDAGYTGMLYGNKEWLLKRIDLTQFFDYDIWLAEQADIPDYPYEYSMWQYTRQGEIYGIDGYVDLNISFIDYSSR